MTVQVHDCSRSHCRSRPCPCRSPHLRLGSPPLGFPLLHRYLPLLSSPRLLQPPPGVAHCPLPRARQPTCHGTGRAGRPGTGPRALLLGAGRWAPGRIQPGRTLAVATPLAVDLSSSASRYYRLLSPPRLPSPPGLPLPVPLLPGPVHAPVVAPAPPPAAVQPRRRRSPAAHVAGCRVACACGGAWM